MSPQSHVALTLPAAAAIHLVFRSPMATLCFVVGGILVDIDHLFDHFILFRKTGGIRGMISWCEQHAWERIVILIHAWELLALFLFLALWQKHILLLSFVLGWAFHLALDQYWNPRACPLHPLFYFLVFRAWKGFTREGLIRKQPGRTCAQDEPVNEPDPKA